MVAEYTPFDTDLANLADIKVYQETVGPTGSSMDWARVPLQFPPKVSSDNRRGHWDEALMPGFEPVATFKNTGPRELNIKLTYIVDGGKWSTSYIASIIKMLRGTFVADDAKQFYFRKLLVKFRLWKFGSPSEITARINSVNVAHSETIVAPCETGQTRSLSLQLAFPLRSDVTLDLRLWRRPDTPSPDLVVQDIEGRLKVGGPEWY